MEKVNYDSLNEKEIWKEIPGYDGRYIISTKDRIIDKRPINLDYNSVWTFEANREKNVKITHIVSLMKNDKPHQRMYHKVKKESFPELYDISDEEVNQIKERINNNKIAVTYDLDTFNRLIFPNKLYYILDVTQYEGRKWRKPTKVEIDDKNHTFVLFKGHKYLGIGITHLIKFVDLFPKNAKPFAESETNEKRRLWMQKKRGSQRQYRRNIFD